MLEEFISLKELESVEALLAKAVGFRGNPDTFRHDAQKDRKEREMRAQKEYEESCRKKYEERMGRKARREGTSVKTVMKATAVPGGILTFGEAPSWLLENMAEKDKGKKPSCREFQRGRCQRGEFCKFDHT